MIIARLNMQTFLVIISNESKNKWKSLKVEKIYSEWSSKN